MNAQEIASQYESPYYCEARAYCDRHDLGPEAMRQVIFSMAHKDFMHMSEPLIKEKAKFLAMYPSNCYFRQDDGSLAKHEIPVETQALLDQIDEIIKSIAGQCGLPLKCEKTP